MEILYNPGAWASDLISDEEFENAISAGWIKLHRKLLQSDIFQNEKMLKVFMYCLLKASHIPFKQRVGRQQVFVGPGQFVFGRKVASADTGMKESTLWEYMKILEEDGVINIKSNNKYSVITIVNWEVYQSQDENSDNKSDSKQTTNQQQIDTYKNVKNSSSGGSSENPFDFYHENLQVGMTSTPFVYQQIEHWINDITPEIVLAAMKLSAKKEKKRL
ncbi:hypothetical protein ACQCVP_11960 [Rossellomorea vietnamensis]|uniref:hypothetical protein n=1 Tax=Rossellomorea vietnamensis TaxID=218284 RepID=UPI003CF79478